MTRRVYVFRPDAEGRYQAVEVYNDEDKIQTHAVRQDSMPETYYNGEVYTSRAKYLKALAKDNKVELSNEERLKEVAKNSYKRNFLDSKEQKAERIETIKLAEYAYDQFKYISNDRERLERSMRWMHDRQGRG